MKRAKQKSELGQYLYSILTVVGLFLVIRTSVVQAFYIPSSSMEDTLLVGDYLLANKFVYGVPVDVPLTSISLFRLPALREPQPGDIVIFRSPQEEGRDLIKRCVAVGGQKVEIVNKVLYVDGERQQDPPFAKYADRRVLPAADSLRDNFGPYIVPEDHFFMMGDNRDNSSDSRYIRAIPKRLIKGKAMIIYWSWKPDTRGPYYRGLSSLPAVVASFIWRLPSRVRYGRLGDVIF